MKVGSRTAFSYISPACVVKRRFNDVVFCKYLLVEFWWLFSLKYLREYKREPQESTVVSTETSYLRVQVPVPRLLWSFRVSTQFLVLGFLHSLSLFTTYSFSFLRFHRDVGKDSVMFRHDTSRGVFWFVTYNNRLSRNNSNQNKNGRITRGSVFS